MKFLKIIPAKKLASFGTRLVGLLFFYTVMRLAHFHKLFVNDAGAFDPFVQVIGAIYGVILAFAIFVIWSQFNEVENHIQAEASSLDDVLRFAEGLNSAANSKIKSALRSYVSSVLKQEWPALSRAEREGKTEKSFVEFTSTVINFTPTNEKENHLYDCLLEVIAQASTHRDERLAKSLTRIPPTLFTFVTVLAYVLLFLVFAYPYNNWLTGAINLSVLLFVLFVADFAVTDLDNPFEGAWNVSPKSFEELASSKLWDA